MPLLLRGGLLWSVPILAPLLGAVASARPSSGSRPGADPLAPRRPRRGRLPLAGARRGAHRQGPPVRHTRRGQPRVGGRGRSARLHPTRSGRCCRARRWRPRLSGPRSRCCCRWWCAAAGWPRTWSAPDLGGRLTAAHGAGRHARRDDRAGRAARCSLGCDRGRAPGRGRVPDDASGRGLAPRPAGVCDPGIGLPDPRRDERPTQPGGQARRHRRRRVRTRLQDERAAVELAHKLAKEMEENQMVSVSRVYVPTTTACSCPRATASSSRATSPLRQGAVRLPARARTPGAPCAHQSAAGRVPHRRTARAGRVRHPGAAAGRSRGGCRAGRAGPSAGDFGHTMVYSPDREARPLEPRSTAARNC